MGGKIVILIPGNIYSKILIVAMGESLIWL